MRPNLYFLLPTCGEGHWQPGLRQLGPSPSLGNEVLSSSQTCPTLAYISASGQVLGGRLSPLI